MRCLTKIGKRKTFLVFDQSSGSQGPDDEGGNGQGDADPDWGHHFVHEVGDLKKKLINI